MAIRRVSVWYRRSEGDMLEVLWVASERDTRQTAPLLTVLSACTIKRLVFFRRRRGHRTS